MNLSYEKYNKIKLIFSGITVALSAIGVFVSVLAYLDAHICPRTQSGCSQTSTSSNDSSVTGEDNAESKDVIYVENSHFSVVNIAITYKTDKWHTSYWMPVAPGTTVAVLEETLTTQNIYIHAFAPDGTTWGRKEDYVEFIGNCSALRAD